MFHYPTKEIKKGCEPIIFIHGTGMDHSVWTLPVRYFLRKEREVLAIDLPGHGDSEGPSLKSIEEKYKKKVRQKIVDNFDKKDR